MSGEVLTFDATDRPSSDDGTFRQFPNSVKSRMVGAAILQRNLAEARLRQLQGNETS